MSGNRTQGLLRVIKEALNIYNKYRSPESKAALVSVEEEIVKVRFEGSFTRTCGINDWVEDFRYILLDMGCNASLEKIIEPEENPLLLGDSRVGVFRVKC